MLRFDAASHRETSEQALMRTVLVRGGFGQELRQICTPVSFEFTVETYTYDVSDTGISKI